jgi:hypothetical protein
MRCINSVLKRSVYATTLLASSLCAYGAIEDQAFGNTRGLGLGGADAAAVNDTSAILVNPAALGFMARSNNNAKVDNFGLSGNHAGWELLDVGISATLTGDLGDYLQTLANLDFSQLDVGNLRNGDALDGLIQLAGVMKSVNDNDTILVNGSVGSLMQIGHFGVGFRTYGQVGGWINDLDLLNLGLDMAVNELATEIQNAATLAPGYTRSTLTLDQQQKLETALGGANPTVQDAINVLDSKINALIDEGKISRAQIESAVDTLANIINSSGTTSLLEDNDTSITGRGFIAFEIPVSFGYAINDNFSVGVTAKAIFGNVYGTQVWAFNEDNEAILEDSLDTFNQSINVGLDASAMYRLPKWQFVVAGNNLNSPTFDGYTQQVSINGTPRDITVPEVTLDPQITLGAAWLPFRRWVLATDYEVLETGTLLNNYNVQRLSFGTEYDLSVVKLRLGTYKNLAESDIGWVLTGGLGFQLWAVYFDAALAVSIDDTVEYDGVEFPRTAQAYLGCGFEF